MTNRIFAARQPTGNILSLTPPHSWPKPALFAFAAEGPACEKCRTSAANSAAEAADHHFEEVCRELEQHATGPILDELATLLERYDAPADAPHHVVAGLAGVFQHTNPQHDLVRVHLTVTGGLRKRVNVRTTSRVPALYFRSRDDKFALNATGRLHKVGYGDGNELLVPKAAEPRFSYFGGSSYNGFESAAGPVLDNGTAENLYLISIEDRNIFNSYYIKAVRALASQVKLPS
jgi:hypothetical protein